MVTPDVHAVCVLHPADDNAARLERVDAAADRQARARADNYTPPCVYCGSTQRGVCRSVRDCGGEA